jgi:YegS/Rv2252/BmrU family lipid kinase
VADRIAVIINPISGTGGRIDVGRARAAYAADLIASQGGDPSLVFLTERPGHARELAKAAMARGVATVVAWGGDGTMNEVASALAFTDTAIAMVPSGSGNGLARELKIPFDRAAAFDVACRGREMVIDAGEIGGRFFFNIAGIGLDARVAHRFAVDGLVRRGFLRYLELTIGELRGYVPDQLTVTTPSSSITKPVLLVAIANGRQYGNGAIIAPAARLDDGQLDVVIVDHRSAFRACLALPLVFMGRAGRVSGLTMESAESVEITAPHPVLYHLDGEPIAGTLSLRAEARPRALRVKVPAN